PVMSEALRQTDFIARWGGEEFVILFPKADAQGATTALEKALEVFRHEEFQVEDNSTSNVTFSAGVTEVSVKATVEEAVAEADRLLYQAKEAGRSRVLWKETDAVPQKKKVLLAEDDEIVASVIKHRLGREGFEVLHYPDGTSALEAAPDLGASLVILDVKMPGMDGFQLLGKLRKHPAYHKTPIIMLTSMGSEEDTVRGFELGADDYIMKPFSPVELLARIRRLVKTAGPPVAGESKKILLVDDDPIILATVAKSLKAAGGYQVIQAQNATEALELASKEHPDTILLDFQLPDMDGPDLLKLLQSEDSLRGIPVVFLTGKTDPMETTHLISLGVKGVLHKPFDPSELASQISDLVDN
ncbi:MAG: response regulator, partial [Fidelibacterota bacterium]